MNTPRFVISKSLVISQYEKAKAHADAISYSSKTNTDITPILEAETDSMFSVHTKIALKHVNDKSRVIFIAQGWTPQDIKDLIELGVKWFVVDNEVDLDTLLEFVKTLDIKINLLLRLKLKENTIKTEKYYVFGMKSQTIETRINEIRNNKELSKRIEKLGIHFHRKTQNMSEWKLKYELINTFETDFWKKINVVNIGGGLPSVYANTNIKVFDGIFSRIDEFRLWLNNQNIEMIIEPGRFIAAPAVKLKTKIIAIHENTIIVDASVYNGDLDAIVVPIKLLIEGELPKGEKKPFIVKGVTPCSMDIFRYKVYLDNPKVGDLLVFKNAGAYNFASDFCDLLKVEREIVE